MEIVTKNTLILFVFFTILNTNAQTTKAESEDIAGEITLCVGPIANQARAEQICPQACASYKKQWKGLWAGEDTRCESGGSCECRD